MKEELFLKQRIGNNRPFKVPEGYFSSLEDKVMQNIPEPVSGQERIAKRVFLRPLRWAACFAVVLFVSGMIYFNKINKESDFAATDNISENMSSSVYADYILDEISDCAMLDNEDFYSYITNE